MDKLLCPVKDCFWVIRHKIGDEPYSFVSYEALQIHLLDQHQIILLDEEDSKMG